MTAIPVTEAPTNPRKWLWNSAIPMQTFVLLAAAGASGKTTFLRSLIAKTTVGGTWPDGEPCERGRVLVIHNGEEDEEWDWKPSIRFGGGDVDWVTFQRTKWDDGRQVDINGDFHHIRKKIMALGNSGMHGHRPRKVKLIIIDPLREIVSDMNQPVYVKPAAEKLNRLAKECECALIAITHLNKEGKIQGSHLWWDLPRLVYTLREWRNDTRLLIPEKPQIPEIAERRHEVIRIGVKRGVQDGIHTASAVIHPRREPYRLIHVRSKEAQAAAAQNIVGWIKRQLAMGERSLEVMRKAARKMDYNWKRVKEIAIQHVGVIEMEIEGEAFWRLPEEGE